MLPYPYSFVQLFTNGDRWVEAATHGMPDAAHAYWRSRFAIVPALPEAGIIRCMFGLTRRHRLLLMGVGLVLGTILLYWPTLMLPLLFDDLLHIRLAKGMNFVSVWLPSTDFGFFRPLVFLPFLVIKLLFGHYPKVLLHGLNVVHHAINVLLVFSLAWRLWRNWSRALTAGVLIGGYPFAYQAIAFYGNNSYPSSAGFILLALHSYLSAIQPGARRRWWFATGVAFALGLLVQETVVLFGLLAALLHWAHQGTGPWKVNEWRESRTSRGMVYAEGWMWKVWQQAPYLPFILLGGIYAIAYQFLPVGGGPQFDPGGNEALPKLLYLLQSVGYPFAWFAHLLPDLSANAIIFMSFGLTVALTLWVAGRQRCRLALLMGWAWWGLSSLLVGLNLPTYYVLHGARLLYLGGVGAALVWAVLLGYLFEFPKAGRWLWSIALGFIVVTTWSFVRDRLAAFADISNPIAVVEKMMRNRPDEEGVLLVNLPQWTSPARNTYAVGVEYVTLMGWHLFAEELIGENLDRYRPVLSIEVPDLLTDTGYPYGVHNQTQVAMIQSDWAPAGSQVFIIYYTEEGIETEHTGWFAASTGSLTLATFQAHALTNAQANVCEEVVRVTLSWERSAMGESLGSDSFTGTISGFVQLLDAEGRLISQLDGPPLRLRPDLIRLLPGWQMGDRRSLPLPEDAHPAELMVGIYDYTSGQRIPAVDGVDVPLPDNALRLPVTSYTPSPNQQLPVDSPCRSW